MNVPTGTPVPIRPAVSVLVVRDGSSGPEVFVQHRVQTMDFAAGAVVFPGGRVDPVDYARAQARAAEQGFDSARFAAHERAWAATDMAAVPLHPAVLLACGRREVEEETGSLLPGDCLLPWANWVTPPGPPRRFDTYFYVAPASAAGLLRNTTTEAKRSEWLPAAGLLERGDAGELLLMRPTRTLLEELVDLGGWDAVRAASAHRSIVPVRNDRPQV
jgi:8-oxo-dGTP pyrophosphatase MutT (NUDIX family)